MPHHSDVFRPPFPSRVMLGISPRLYRELIHFHLDRQPGIRVVGEVAHPRELAEAIRRHRFDVLVHQWAVTGEASAAFTLAQSIHPTLLIVGLGNEGSGLAGFRQPFELYHSSLANWDALMRMLRTPSARPLVGRSLREVVE